VDSFREGYGEGVEILVVAKTRTESDNREVGMVPWHNWRLVHFHQIRSLGFGHHKGLVYGQELGGRIDGPVSYGPACGLAYEHLHHTVSSLLRRRRLGFVTGADA